MALSASLHLRQSQSLVMTPQLMQSIQLLQMTHVELLGFIAQEVERNPLLELAGGEAEPLARGQAEGDSEPSVDVPDGAGDSDASAGEADADWSEMRERASIAETIDENYDNVFQDDAAERRADAPELLSQWKSMPGGQSGAGEGYDLDDFAAGQVSLRDHLNQQIPFVLSNPAERMIGQLLVDQLDEAGYVAADLDHLADRLGKGKAEIEAVLARLQGLDPPGIFARSLSECLAIQLKARDRLDPAMAALLDHLELLARRDFQSLKRICGVDEADLIDMLAEIRTLDPKPGSAFVVELSESIIPDIIVRPAQDGSWHVELNAETLPRVLVNQDYYAKVSAATPKGSADQAFLNECLQSANWLTRSLDQRARTIMKVASEIVRQQDAFLLNGVDHLRPLNLKTIAEAIKMHESTVSRVTANKYMLTPRGLFELKYFFTVSIGSSEGGESHSAEAVRSRIRAMIGREQPGAVLSDDDIVKLLAEGGIDLARRTVAKYREAMNIPSSVQRRREKKAQARAAGF
jgi:RNA polymerase sigma-54 factor